MTSQQDLNNLIKEIKYARKLHEVELKYFMKEHKKAMKEKDVIISVLQGNDQNIRLAKEILRRWQQRHYFWIDLVRKNKKWAKEGGSVSWHKRWIRLYQQILDYLKEKK